MTRTRRFSRLLAASSSTLLASSMVVAAPFAGAVDLSSSSSQLSSGSSDAGLINPGRCTAEWTANETPAQGKFAVDQQATALDTWRVAVASDNYLKDPTITLTVPAGTEISLAPVPAVDAATIGDSYEGYKWSTGTPTATDNGDGTWTIELGNLYPKQGYAFLVTAIAPADAEPVAVSATLTATQASGKDATDSEPCPALPADTPPMSTDLGRCEVEYVGRTVWNKFDGDITDREKYYNSGDGVQVTDEFGETNNDGWGRNTNLGADGYTDGNTRTLRLYGGTHQALKDVTWTSEIQQGAEFTGSFTLYDPAGRWTLPSFTTGAPFPATPTLDSPTKVSVTGVDMPADSWFAYNAPIEFTEGDETPVVIYHRLRGTLEDCDPNAPVPSEGSSVDPLIPLIIGGSAAGALLSSAGSSGSSSSSTGTLPAPGTTPAPAPAPTENPAQPTAKPAPAEQPQAQEAPRKRLANTGASVLGVLVAAAVAAAAGAALIRRSRKES